MTDSRYVRYDKRRLPREKRVIKLFGATSYIAGKVVKDQSNTLYRCWNCGFVCHSDRDKLGDGVGYVVKDEPDLPAVLNMGAGAYEFPGENANQDVAISLETGNTLHLMNLDSNGDPMTVRHNFTSTISSGCPFCGCRQYK
jgi:hypothetical protein